MAEVTGPISSLPGRSHAVPEGMTCDQHPDRPAVARIQGETDSFGCEMIDMCQECSDDYRAYMKSDEAKEDRKGNCEWCGQFADDLREARDYEEGMSGRVYRVCGACIRRVNEEAAAELDYLDDLDFPEPDDDYCGRCCEEGDLHGCGGVWHGYCTCETGLRLKGEAEARYRAKSEVRK
ncbi:MULTISPECIES: hypothetical protein [Rhizobium/Agrobacterium group]|uniref:Uncharacterized protein n=1 Tax=Rhizobium rhizogenes TaxID=359 RepID=A0A546XIA1_RHIRH|nr:MULTISPECIES: hypothetical protein [Rhizobium/Agrobacterium group]TRB00432.1 hypothetical protein EXN68_11995 [Rhizobium rhizogenes]